MLTLVSTPLPEFHQKLIRLLGYVDTVSLLSNYGGTRIYIPCVPDQTLNLKGTISDESIKRLCAVYGSNRIYLPKLDKLTVTERNREILRQLSAGTRTKEIARKFKLSVRQVRRVKNNKSGHVLPY